MEHQYEFNLEIPRILITKDLRSHDKINFDLLEGKILIGLCGYARSGKDTVAEKFVKGYDFHRVAFADNIKKDMNLFMRDLVFEDINKKNLNKTLSFDDIDFVDPKTHEIKEILRPYVIWFGEKLREINGPFFWINRAFQYDAKDHLKIVISDVRRPKELEIFKDSNTFIRKTEESFAQANFINTNAAIKANSYSTLLFWVNQLGLTDSDKLTLQTIQEANEQWLFDDVIFVDSRIPEHGKYRENALNQKIKYLAQKYGIKKDVKTSKNQMNIFNSN